MREPAELLARQVPHPMDIQLKMAPVLRLALPAGCLRFGRLRCLLHLREHLANSVVGPGAALLAPRFQVVALFFQVGRKFGLLNIARHAASTGFTCSNTAQCSPLLSKKNSSSISPRFTMLATISQ